MIPRTMAVAALFLAVVTTNQTGFPGASGAGRNERGNNAMLFAGSVNGLPLRTMPRALSAVAMQDWTEFKYPERGFAARFPVAPTPQEQILGDEGNKYTQYMYMADLGEHAYMLCVFEYKPGVVPSTPDGEYFGKLIDAYTSGSKTTLRKKYPKTIAGHNGMEAIADDADGSHTHMLGVIAVGNRLYLTVSLGPTGHETSAEAIRFRDSFRLL